MAIKEKLAELIVDINAKLEPLKGSLSKANAMLKRGFATMGRMARRAALAIGVALVAAFAWATKAAMTQEDAEIALARALALTNDATKKNMDRLKKYASAIQDVTKQGDEATLALMAQLKTLGVHTDKLEEGARAYIAFQHMAMRGNTALKAAAALMKGDTSLLRSYSSELRAAKTQAEQMAIAQEMVNRGFAAEEAAADSTSGALVQLRNKIGDIAEVIAARFLPRIKEMADATKIWATENERLIEEKFNLWLDRTGRAMNKLSTAIQYVIRHWKKFAAGLAAIIGGQVIIWLAAVAKGVAFLVATVGGAVVATAASLASILGLLTAIVAVFVKYTNLMRIAAKNAIALTQKEIDDYKEKHRFMQIAAKALRTSNMKGLRDIESLISARKRLRAELAKQRKTGDNEVGVRKATTGLVRAMEKEVFITKTEWDKRKAAVAEAAAKPPPKTDEEIKIAEDAAKQKLKDLQAYYVKVGGYEKQLAAVRKALRLQEATDLARKIGGDPLKIFRELDTKAREKKLEEALRLAKKTPAEVAKLGLTSFQASWGQIATGAKRIDEQSLAKLTKIETELRQIREQGAAGAGMQLTGSRPF